jgi:hypothetical protein
MQTQVIYIPLNFPWTRPATRLERRVDTTMWLNFRLDDAQIPNCNSVWWGPTEQGRPGTGRPITASVLLFQPAPSV